MSNELDLDALTQAIRTRAQVHVQRHPSWGYTPATDKQRKIILIALQDIYGCDNRDARIWTAQRIWPAGIQVGADGPEQVALTSFNHLTKAMATTLIEFLYRLGRHDSFYVGRELYWKARRYFLGMAQRFEQEAAELPL